MLGRGTRLGFGFLALAFASAAAAQGNLDQGKTGAQLYASACATCHKSPPSLSKTRWFFRLESFLRWSDQPLVKLAESALIFLLMLHMFGGLRLLVIENLSWRDGQKQAATIVAGVSAAIAFFLLARMF